jgi:hypothetical protein
VVGEEEASRQRESKKKKLNIYGPRVVGSPEPSEPTGPSFTASAEALRKELKIPVSVFAGRTPSGKTGDFLKSDVEAVAEDLRKAAEASNTNPPPETAGGGEGEPLERPQLTEDAKAEHASLDLEALGKLLEEEPAKLDRQIDAEFQRAEGPRTGALRLFLQHEAKREGGPRGDVMALLETHLRDRNRS